MKRNNHYHQVESRFTTIKLAGKHDFYQISVYVQANKQRGSTQSVIQAAIPVPKPPGKFSRNPVSTLPPAH